MIRNGRTVPLFQKMSQGNRWFPIAVITLCCINLAIFLSINLTPILWQQGEFGFYNLFWSTQWEARGDLLLESGLHLTDFLKIFDSENLDNWFRARQFSYVMEMLTLKIKQSLEIVSFRSFSYIIFHGINVILCFLLIRHITKSRRTALLTAMLCLNSGVAVSTLLFPFRNAKLLLMTLMLCTWWGILVTKGSIWKTAKTRVAAFIAITLCALLTDELALILLPLSFLLMIWKSPLKKDNVRKAVIILVLTLLIYQCVRTLFMIIGAQFHVSIVPNLLGVYLKQLTYYYSAGITLIDIFHAFFGHFLRKNFGYWELSFWGTLSLVAFLGLMVFVLQSKYPKKIKQITWTLAGTLAVMLIVYFDVITINLPRQFFPSMFFYNYYYTYPASILVCLLLGCAMTKSIEKSQAIFLAAFLFATIINVSNFTHKDQLLEIPLKIHGYHHTHQRVIPHIARLNKNLPKLQSGPVYLSFPSGSQPVFKRKLGAKNLWDIDPLGARQELHPDFVSYASLIPANFLRPIERGDIVMSLKNVIATQKSLIPNDLHQVQWFYDLPEDQWFNLNGQKLLSIIIKDNPFHGNVPLPISQQPTRCIFLVKGAAIINIKHKDKQVNLRQRYGHSFQMFHFLIPGHWQRERDHLHITVTPITKSQHIEWIGPLFLNEDQGHFKQPTFPSEALVPLPASSNAM